MVENQIESRLILLMHISSRLTCLVSVDYEPDPRITKKVSERDDQL